MKWCDMEESLQTIPKNREASMAGISIGLNSRLKCARIGSRGENVSMESDVNLHMAMLTWKIKKSLLMSCISLGLAKAFIKGRLDFAFMETDVNLSTKIGLWVTSRTIIMYSSWWILNSEKKLMKEILTLVGDFQFLDKLPPHPTAAYKFRQLASRFSNPITMYQINVVTFQNSKLNHKN